MYIIYASQSRELLDSRELENLRHQAAFYNEISMITGVHLYNQGCFLGIIEGKKRFVKQLWKKIQLDSRHREIIKLSESGDSRSYFKSWDLISEPANFSYNFREKDILPEYGDASPTPFFLRILINLHAHYLRLQPKAAEFDELKSNFDLRFQLLSNSYHCQN